MGRGGHDRAARAQDAGAPVPGAERREVRAPQRELFRDERQLLSERELRVLQDVGAFRVVRPEDLERQVYGGDRQAFSRDLYHLIHNRGLARRVKPAELPGGRGRALARDGYVTLTDRGREVASALRSNPRQTLYAGVRKPHEVWHDAHAYRAFQDAAERLLAQGRSVERVVLDYEFKRALNRDIQAAKRLPPDQALARLEAIAEAHHLTVVDGQIPLPDVRLEWQDEAGETGVFDLEITTENYRAGALMAKAAAGFAMYAPAAVVAKARAAADGQGGRGTRTYDRDLAAALIAL